MRKFGLGMLTVVLMIAVFFGTKMYYEPDKTEVKEDEAGIIEEETVHTAKTIMDGFKNMGQLVTQDYYFTQVEQFSEELTIKGYSIPFTLSAYTISYDGSIKAGIDFSAITVAEDGNRLFITVPKAEIFGAELDEESFKVYDEKNSIFNKIELTDMNESRKQLKENAREKAIEKGILENAERNARVLIENFVNSVVGDGQYTIIYVSV